MPPSVGAGHSLGGALATLAGYDIARACPGAHVSCYTFGAPRAGNHACAREFDRVLPDNWSVINGSVSFTVIELKPESVLSENPKKLI